MSPQFLDERAQASRQIAPFLRAFVRYSVICLVTQVVVAALLLAGVVLKETEAYGVTQSGAVFKLELAKRK